MNGALSNHGVLFIILTPKSSLPTPFKIRKTQNGKQLKLALQRPKVLPQQL
jgi:hypothetical protein